MNEIVRWMQAVSGSREAVFFLVFVSFADSSFFPVPPDFLLIPMCALRPQKCFFLAAVTTVSSVLGAALGFVIGRWGGEPLCHKWFGKRWEKAEAIFRRYQSLAVAVAALSPIPYKLMTIGTGALAGSFKNLIWISLVFRGLRFFAEALLLYYFGKPMQDWIFQNFDKMTLIAAFTLVIAYGVFQWKKQKKSHPIAASKDARRD